MKVAVCLLSAMMSLSIAPSTSAAPLVEINKNENRDKRSDEVIFFENGAQGGDVMKKRSESWPILNNQPMKAIDTSTEMPNALAPHQNPGKPQSESMMDGDDYAEQLKEWIFEQELNDYVNKLIAEVFQEELNEYMLDQSTDVITTEKPLPEETTTTVALEPTKPLDREPDTEADELTSLVVGKEDSKRAPYSPLPVEANEQYNKETDDSRNMYDSMPAYYYGHDQLRLKDTEPPAESDTDSYMDLKMVNEDGRDKMEDGDYSMSEIVKDFKYFEELTALEKKLRAELSNFRSTAPQELSAEDEEDSGKDQPHSRKRRSVSDDWFGAEERQPRNEKICFTSEEVRQLREILLELAKERLDSEKIITFLISDDNKPGVVFNEPDAEQWFDNEILDDEEDGTKLDNLAMRLNQQNQSPAAYFAYNQAAKRRSYYGPY